VSILTKALETVNVNLITSQITPITGCNNTHTLREGINSAIISLDEYAFQQNLDNKQKVAFKTICSSFMLSYLSEISVDITPGDVE
jgi:hypothetical protein